MDSSNKCNSLLSLDLSRVRLSRNFSGIISGVALVFSLQGAAEAIALAGCGIGSISARNVVLPEDRHLSGLQAAAASARELTGYCSSSSSSLNTVIAWPSSPA